MQRLPEPKTEHKNNPNFWLHPVTPNEFLPPISPWATVGGVVLLGIFGTVIILAAILKYKVVIKAPATIRPTGELRLVQAATAGTIKSIAVQANQVLRQGDVIATIDDSRLQTQKKQLLTNIQQAKLQLSQLDAQIRALDAQVAAESDRINHDITSVQAELSRNQRELKDQQISSIAQATEAAANLQHTQKEWQKTQLKLKSAFANLKSSEAAFKAAKARRDRYQPLAQSGSISIDQFQEAQLAVEQQEQLLESQKATVEEYRQAVGQQQQAIEAAKARQQVALVALTPSNANVVISKEKIAAETATGKINLARLNQQRAQLIHQKFEIQKQLSSNTQELQQVNKEITDTTIRASASGTIQELNLRNPQQLLGSGDVIAKIAPSDSPLVIKALVASEEIPQIQIDQRVEMQVAGCSYTDYGTLSGVVKEISPDAISSADASSTTANRATYEVTIQPEGMKLSDGSRKCTIQSGMDGRVDIISRQETVLVFMLRKARLLMDL
ncbi:MAG: HlyD family secretion protein [Goleter apudmare HA4340-LM2]|nr:HlyD family secretion protein [Goleter apudmare HA4340-LM2]